MPANQAGKGPQPRAYDTTEYAAGVERVFGKKKPWWVLRDESIAAQDLVIPADEDFVRPEDAISTGPDPIADPPDPEPVSKTPWARLTRYQLKRLGISYREGEIVLIDSSRPFDKTAGEFYFNAEEFFTRQELLSMPWYGETLAPEPEPFTPYQVPLIPDATFGTRLELPHRDELVITLRRGPSGWCVPQDMRHVRHPWQMYVADIDSASEHYGAKEIAVVGLNSGTWVTVWASSPSEISYPPADSKLAN